MKKYYESPAAEVIDFRAREDLAVVPEGPGGNEDVGPGGEGSVASRDF